MVNNPYKFIWEQLKNKIDYWDYIAQKGGADGHEVANAIRNIMETLEKYNIEED